MEAHGTNKLFQIWRRRNIKPFSTRLLDSNETLKPLTGPRQSRSFIIRIRRWHPVSLPTFPCETNSLLQSVAVERCGNNVCKFWFSLLSPFKPLPIKSAMFLTEQKQNMGRIKGKRKCMQPGRQFAGWHSTSGLQNSFVRRDCEDVLYQAALTPRLKREKRGLICASAPAPARLWSGETKEIVEAEEK